MKIYQSSVMCCLVAGMIMVCVIKCVYGVLGVSLSEIDVKRKMVDCEKFYQNLSKKYFSKTVIKR